MAVTEDKILEALRQLEDPDLHRDVVSLGFVKGIQIDGGKVSFNLELTTPACPVKDQLQAEAQRLVSELPGVEEVTVTLTAQVPKAKTPTQDILPGVRHTIAVASGKGGVGKSTVAVNLAAALARTGARVGLMDADVYGPSIPIMLGLTTARPEVQDGKLLPLERYGIHLMSLGFIAGEDAPVIWRGPMVTKLLQQFLGDVAWGELDYLIVDLPPGTGDAQLTLAQAAPLAGAVIVTTPQPVALEDVKRGIGMFEKVDVPVLGVIENMSFFVCDGCNKRHEIFAHGGGEEAAKKYKVPFLGGVPLDPPARDAGDKGRPVVLSHPEAPSARALAEVAGEVARGLSTQALQEAETTA